MPNSFLTTTAWVLEKNTLVIVDDIISARLNGSVRDLSEFEASLGKKVSDEAPEKPYAIFDGVAVIDVIGVIGKRFNMFSNISGGVSTERLQHLIYDAMTDPLVEAVVLKMDSPGGTVDGTAELGDWLAELRLQKDKPLFGFVDGTCCSGCYWVGCYCDEIHAFRTSQVGSISAVVCHYDRSRSDKKNGVKRTFITSGEYKRVASDAAPLDKKGKAYLQYFIDNYHAMFIEAVAEGRGLAPEEVQKRFGDGKVHLAQEALDIGMIDHISTLAETINAARSAAREEQKMSMTKEKFAADHPELHAQLVAEAADAAQVEFEGQVKAQVDSGIAAEQERMFSVYGQLHGEDKKKAFTQLVSVGLSGEQLEGLKVFGFGGGGKTPEGGGKTPEQQILDVLENDDQEELSNGGSGGPIDFMAAVDAHVESARCTRSEAIKVVAGKFPDLHKKYIERK